MKAKVSKAEGDEYIKSQMMLDNQPADFISEAMFAQMTQGFDIFNDWSEIEKWAKKHKLCATDLKQKELNFLYEARNETAKFVRVTQGATSRRKTLLVELIKSNPKFSEFVTDRKLTLDGGGGSTQCRKRLDVIISLEFNEKVVQHRSFKLSEILQDNPQKEFVMNILLDAIRTKDNSVGSDPNFILKDLVCVGEIEKKKTVDPGSTASVPYASTASHHFGSVKAVGTEQLSSIALNEANRNLTVDPNTGALSHKALIGKMLKSDSFADLPLLKKAKTDNSSEVDFNSLMADSLVTTPERSRSSSPVADLVAHPFIFPDQGEDEGIPGGVSSIEKSLLASQPHAQSAEAIVPHSPEVINSGTSNSSCAAGESDVITTTTSSTVTPVAATKVYFERNGHHLESTAQLCVGESLSVIVGESRCCVFNVSRAETNRCEAKLEHGSTSLSILI